MVVDSEREELSEDLRSLLVALAHAPSGPLDHELRIAPGDRIGRYALERVIGRGGFGVVFAAHDAELGRRVAIKVTRGEPTPDVLARFQREAQLAAQLNHPNLVTLHDSGVIAGLPYLVLELLDGETLAARIARARAPLPTAEALAIIADVVRALIPVHAAGIVHADLKPANVFLTADGRVKVLDFGLAHLHREATAERAGTPTFMAPEQARGESTDPRTDMFGAGMTLRAMVGEAPAAGVRRVVARATAADPATRFASAAELLAAVTAVAQRRTRRRIAIAGAAIVVAGAVAMIVVGPWSAWRAGRRSAAATQLAERAGREAEAITADLRFARVQPLHDLRPQQLAAQRRVRALAAEVEAAGDSDTPVVEIAVARAEAALHDMGAARARLEAVLAHGDRSPAALAALGGVLLDDYEQRAARVMLDADPARRAHAIAVLDAELRAPALDDLHAAAEDTPLVRARIALYERHDDDARRLARVALAADPGQFEAAALIGDAYMVEAEVAARHGQFVAIDEPIARAGDAYADAIAIARSDPALYVADCRRWSLALAAATVRGRDGTAAFAAAQLACGHALVADPDDVAAVLALAAVAARRALGLSGTGVDPQPVIAAVLPALIAARLAHPDDGELPRMAGSLLLAGAEFAAEHGRDPRVELAAAEAAFRAAWALSPDGDARGYLGQIAVLRAEAELARGDDPTAAVEQALALQRDLGGAQVATSMGRAWTVRGTWEGLHDRDPRASLDAAIAAFERGRAINAASAAADEEGGAWQAKAAWERRHGIDAAPSLDRAIACSEAVLAVDANDLTGHGNLGEELTLRADAERARGVDPAPFVRRAIAELDAAIAIDPADATPHANLGIAHEQAARGLLAAHRDPSGELRTAEAELARAQAIARDDRTVLPVECQLARDAAAWLATRGSPLAALARAHTACAAALALAPEDPELAAPVDAVTRELARWTPARK